ncbi:MAG TPA: hypothetical protein VNA87_07370 [Actinomycetota bacterium]|nr:hypothetical protein [Actinomycetota bacterium]
MLAKIVIAVLFLNIVGGGAFFIAHTIREHPRSEAVWAITVGTDETEYTHVTDDSRTFWEETLLVALFVGINALILVAFGLLGVRHP